MAGVVRFIDPHTGRDLGDPISYGNGPPISLSWSPDGRRLVVATADNFLHVYDARTRRAVVDNIENVDAKYLDVAFSNDGRYIYVGNYLDRDISILRVEGDQIVNTGKSLALPGQPASMRSRTR